MIYDCVVNMWSPTIGDPHIMGWVTVACYFITATLAIITTFHLKKIVLDIELKRTQLFWILICLALVALGINKQLDLQSFFTAVAKCTAKIEGWYAERRVHQERFILIIGITFSLVTLFMLFFFRKNLSENFIAVIGFAVLLAFIFIRALSFHHFDILINTHIAGIRMNWVLELSGLFLISIQAIKNIMKQPMAHIDVAKLG